MVQVMKSMTEATPLFEEEEFVGHLWTDTDAGSSDMDSNEVQDISNINESAGNGALNFSAVEGMILSIVGAGFMDGIAVALLRFAGMKGIAAVEVALLRSLLQTMLFGTIVFCQQETFRPPKGQVTRCIIVAICFALASLTSHVAFDFIPPGNAIAVCGFFRMLSSLFGACVLLKEKIEFQDISAMLICIGGVPLIMYGVLTSGDRDHVSLAGSPDDPVVIQVVGYVLIIASGTLWGAGVVAYRGAKGELGSSMVVFYQSMLIALGAVIPSIVMGRSVLPTTLAGIGYTFCVSLATCSVSFSSIYAAKFMHPALCSLGLNTDIPVSIFLLHSLLAVLPNPLVMTGASMILLAVCGLALLKFIQSRQGNPKHET